MDRQDDESKKGRNKDSKTPIGVAACGVSASVRVTSVAVWHVGMRSCASGVARPQSVVSPIGSRAVTQDGAVAPNAMANPPEEISRHTNPDARERIPTPFEYHAANRFARIGALADLGLTPSEKVKKIKVHRSNFLRFLSWWCVRLRKHADV